jgi:hypothetical protein
MKRAHLCAKCVHQPDGTTVVESYAVFSSTALQITVAFDGFYAEICDMGGADFEDARAKLLQYVARVWPRVAEAIAKQGEV